MRLTLRSPEPFLKLLIGSVRVPRPPSKDILLIRTVQDTLVGLDALVGRDFVYLDTGCFSPVPSQLRVSWRMLLKGGPWRGCYATKQGSFACQADGEQPDNTRNRRETGDTQIWCRFWALCGRAFGPLMLNECWSLQTKRMIRNKSCHPSQDFSRVKIDFTTRLLLPQQPLYALSQSRRSLMLSGPCRQTECKQHA